MCRQSSGIEIDYLFVMCSNPLCVVVRLLIVCVPEVFRDRNRLPVSTNFFLFKIKSLVNISCMKLLNDHDFCNVVIGVKVYKQCFMYNRSIKLVGIRSMGSLI